MINLEDDAETSAFLREVKFGKLHGALLDPNGEIVYADDSYAWSISA